MQTLVINCRMNYDSQQKTSLKSDVFVGNQCVPNPIATSSQIKARHSTQAHFIAAGGLFINDR